jgi:8-oxo-dGTP pyrophosphatase MutT (NUDIX family)
MIEREHPRPRRRLGPPVGVDGPGGAGQGVCGGVAVAARCGEAGVAVTVVLDESAERVLLLRRHRFIVDRLVWELPGGYVDDGEDPAAAAAREVEEETGWRPGRVEFVLSCQPLIGNADYPQDLYVATGAELTGEPEADETAEVRWVPLADAQAMIASGEIAGAMTVIGVQHALLLRAAAR